MFVLEKFSLQAASFDAKKYTRISSVLLRCYYIRELFSGRRLHATRLHKDRHVVSYGEEKSFCREKNRLIISGTV